MSWPWPLSAIEDWMKDLKSTIERILRNVLDRMHLRGEGIDTWIGRIYDEFSGYLVRKDKGIDHWIGEILDEIKDISVGPIDIDLDPIYTVLDNLLLQFTQIKTSFQSGINSILANANSGFLTLKGELENYITNSLTNLQTSLEAQWQTLLENIAGIGDIDLTNLPQLFINTLADFLTIDQQELDDIMEVRFPSG